MKTLVRLPNWVGDTLLALPAIEGLAGAHGTDLILAGRSLPLEIVAHLVPGARRVLLRRGDAAGVSGLAAVHALRSLHATRALLLTPSFSSALMTWAAGIPRRIGWDEQGRGFLLTDRIARGPRGAEHIMREYNALARAAGARVIPPHPVLPADAAASESAERFLGGRAAVPRVALCPGVKYGSAKQWPPESFRELRAELEDHGIPGLIVGAPGEEALGESILSGAGAGWINGAGSGSLRHSAELLRRVEVAVCNDTGTMHLAAAVGCRVVALIGPSDPAWTGPLGERHRLLRTTRDCAPCFRRHCPEGRPAPCMRDLRPTNVAQAVARQLGDAGPGRPALFIDRDGTLIEPIPYLHDPAQVRLVRGAGEALSRAHAAGYALVVVTNQSGIARGLYGPREMDAVHAALQSALAADGVAIDAFYHCPHHPDFTGPCTCRKPAPGMLHSAAEDLHLDLGRSVMIGDTWDDVQAGRRAGCRAILVKTGYGRDAIAVHRVEISPEIAVVDDLPAAIDLLGRL